MKEYELVAMEQDDEVTTVRVQNRGGLGRVFKITLAIMALGALVGTVGLIGSPLSSSNEEIDLTHRSLSWWLRNKRHGGRASRNGSGSQHKHNHQNHNRPSDQTCVCNLACVTGKVCGCSINGKATCVDKPADQACVCNEACVIGKVCGCEHKWKGNVCGQTG